MGIFSRRARFISRMNKSSLFAYSSLIPTDCIEEEKKTMKLILTFLTDQQLIKVKTGQFVSAMDRVWLTNIFFAHIANCYYR